MVVPTRLYEAYIFDLDGTIYLGHDLLPGAKRLIEELRARGKAVRFLSNNPTRDREMYVTKLTKLGIPAQLDDIVNTVVTMTRWLLANHPDAVVFPIAEQPLIRALEQAGIRMSEDPSKIDIVIASYDRGFEYRKLQIAFDAIWYYKRARLVATNPDPYCPMDEGRGEPDAAAVIAAIQACTGAKLEANTGKPDPIMLRAALEGLDVNPSDCAMVGDRMSTDIRMALDTGMASVLVLTGETTLKDLEGLSPADTPDFVLDRVDRLLPAEIWEELGWNDQDA
ncbi:MAG: HAD family hydrolase [Candidatus Nephthysia bennettiae]|uniref:HAD-IIA family hydrolase n=1 Tax=Candidatus Nephthysia bennettiae TaxID=3127016 RepID=A0A934K445_9BACT|nr:HAD-IIA family hydrolase [Candidatus Dormibacteraeota bacterium]PZR95099.1 MAG: HAD family hydrolase [Candidatus Dormibacteraeota bacterium]